MKTSTHITILIIAVLLCFTFTAAKSNKKKSHSQGQHKQNIHSFTDLTTSTHPKEKRLSVIEAEPYKHVILNPLNKEQNDALWPRTVYKNDSAAYYDQVPVDLSKVEKGKPVLVANTDVLRNTQFDDKIPHRDSQHDSKPAIYQNDQSAYYNPVESTKNVLHFKKPDTIFSIPIDYKKHLQEDQEHQEKYRRQLIHNPRFYYDGGARTHRDLDEQDPIKRTLMQAAEEEAKATRIGTTQLLEDHQKAEALKNKNIKLVLGYTEPPPQRGHDQAVNQKLRISKSKRQMQEIHDRKENIQTKPNDIFYDASA